MKIVENNNLKEDILKNIPIKFKNELIRLNALDSYVNTLIDAYENKETQVASSGISTMKRNRFDWNYFFTRYRNVDLSFNWGSTKEGHSYWSNIHYSMNL